MPSNVFESARKHLILSPISLLLVSGLSLACL